MTKLRKIAIGVFSIGTLVLVAGILTFVLNLNQQPGVRDAEYLVNVKNWTRKDTPEVAWNFTEVGKGTLTTNNHLNDYDFLWSLEGDTLQIETEWLYDLNDSFTFELDRSNQTLTLSRGDERVVLVAGPRSDE